MEEAKKEMTAEEKVVVLEQQLQQVLKAANEMNTVIENYQKSSRFETISWLWKIITEGKEIFKDYEDFYKEKVEDFIYLMSREKKTDGKQE